MGENSWFYYNPLTKGQFKKGFALLAHRDDRPNHEWWYFARAMDGSGVWTIYKCVGRRVLDTQTGLTGDDAYKQYMKLRKSPWDAFYNADATMEWHKRIGASVKTGRAKPAAKKPISASGAKKPAARKPIKNQAGYELVTKRKKSYTVPASTQTYWKKI